MKITFFNTAWLISLLGVIYSGLYLFLIEFNWNIIIAMIIFIIDLSISGYYWNIEVKLSYERDLKKIVDSIDGQFRKIIK